MKKKIIIIGAGGHAKSCSDVIENLDNKYIISYNKHMHKIGFPILQKKLFSKLRSFIYF